jgi:hypothetical protein
MKSILNFCLFAGVSISLSAQQPVIIKDQGGSGNAASVTSAAALKVDNSAVTQPVNGIGNGAVVSGQQAVTGTAAVLASNSIKQACFSALSTNVISIFLGASGVTTSTGFEMKPGTGVCLPLTNTNLIFVVASTTGATITWLATN